MEKEDLEIELHVLRDNAQPRHFARMAVRLIQFFFPGRAWEAVRRRVGVAFRAEFVDDGRIGFGNRGRRATGETIRGIDVAQHGQRRERDPQAKPNDQDAGTAHSCNAPWRGGRQWNYSPPCSFAATGANPRRIVFSVMARGTTNCNR